MKTKNHAVIDVVAEEDRFEEQSSPGSVWSEWVHIFKEVFADRKDGAFTLKNREGKAYMDLPFMLIPLGICAALMPIPTGLGVLAVVAGTWTWRKLRKSDG